MRGLRAPYASKASRAKRSASRDAARLDGDGEEVVEGGGLLGAQPAAAGAAQGAQVEAVGGGEVSAGEVEVAEAAEGARVEAPVAGLARDPHRAPVPDLRAPVVAAQRGQPPDGEGGARVARARQRRGLGEGERRRQPLRAASAHCATCRHAAATAAASVDSGARQQRGQHPRRLAQLRRRARSPPAPPARPASRLRREEPRPLGRSRLRPQQHVAERLPEHAPSRLCDLLQDAARLQRFRPVHQRRGNVPAPRRLPRRRGRLGVVMHRLSDLGRAPSPRRSGALGRSGAPASIGTRAALARSRRVVRSAGKERRPPLSAPASATRLQALRGGLDGGSAAPGRPERRKSITSPAEYSRAAVGEALDLLEVVAAGEERAAPPRRRRAPGRSRCRP